MRHLVPESELPARYQAPWRPGFVSEALKCVPETGIILDVGGGARPTLTPVDRPPACRYIGLDPDRNELEQGAYDEIVISGASDPLVHLSGQVDLILSWDTLEHVPDMRAALTNFHDLLKPGGILLARFSGRWALFAIAARLMPHMLRTWLLASLIGSNEDNHFPTHYDRSTSRQFHKMLGSWSSYEIIPHYHGAGYLAFSRPLQRAYLLFEEKVAMRTPELATHYQVRAVK